MLAGLPATAGAFLIPRSVIQAAPASDDDFTFFPLVGSRAGELRCVPYGRQRQQHQQETAAPSDWGGRQTNAHAASLARCARALTPGGYLMHTPSTRILSALAYDRGEEYAPAQPIGAALLETLSLVEHACPVIGEDGPYERARRRRREREQLSRIPNWSSV